MDTGPTTPIQKQPCAWLCLILALSLATGCDRNASTQPGANNGSRTFAVTGVVQEISPNLKSVVINHDEVPGFMHAMSMPFEVKDTNLLTSLRPQDTITFRLTVTGDDGWIDQIKVLSNSVAAPSPIASAPNKPAADPDVMSMFTNEFGQAVKMTDFSGKAIALTFFLTRCPISTACPRLSQNFAAASQILASRPGTPTNWQFISISIDSENDTPAVLRRYGKRYNYNPIHWTFLTGPEERVANLTRMFGFEFKPEAGTIFSHGFRTVILTPTEKVQQIYPVSGNLSQNIVEDMLKALAATNSP